MRNKTNNKVYRYKDMIWVSLPNVLLICVFTIITDSLRNALGTLTPKKSNLGENTAVYPTTNAVVLPLGFKGIYINDR